ncbi:SusC/RagA family TonB-linked outer membrane protein [Neolewinella persica]|uniref:SusC/RagA family TonB-linked outer membrane protein n=1 Tax=Neolewinella persica TaxID=70998 RepID=UPI00036C587A|nr:TonB-dependent receptor [Neolewinella persica]
MRLSLLLLLFVCAVSLAAQKTVTGTVTDASGETLIGASVLAKGTGSGTVTDLDGKYSLSVPDGVKFLVFTYTGFASQDVPIGNRSVVDVTLLESASQLSEVVVVGYGSQIRSTLTGNIAQIDGEAIENLPVASVEQAMQGRSAGVFVQSVSGKPGGRVNIRVRGSSSISAGNDPLYVVDGVPITSGTFSSPGSGSLNFMADINPNDVASIEILKDASAAAIYGSRAANGVILITTKKGKSGKAKVNVNLSAGSSVASNRREFLNAEEFVSFFRQTAEGAGRYDWANQINDWGLSDDEYTLENITAEYVGFVEGRLDRYSGPSEWRNGETDTDWQDLAFQTGESRNADMSLAGGSDAIQYYTSFGYSGQEGILAGNAFERMTARLNLDAKTTERLNFGMRMSFGRTTNDRVTDDNQFSTPLQLIALAPITPPRDEDGVLLDRPTTTYYNGLIDVEEAARQTVSYRTLTNVFGQYEIAGGLALRAEAGVDVANLKQNRFQGRRTITGASTNGFSESRWSNILNYTTKALLLYDKEVGAGHNFNFVGGLEYQRSSSENVEVEGTEFPIDALQRIASAAEITFGTSDFTEFTFLSYFGRVNYNFQSKYLFSASARLDGSSRFGANNRYGFFPSVAAGWVISQEDFLADNSTVSYLKARASYGLTGNASIANFGSLGLYSAPAYGGVSALSPSQIPNPDLTWEQTAQFDVGLDFGFLNNRFSGELDFYVKNTTDLLLDVPVPGSSGFRTQLQNIGEMRNTGIEFLLNANVLTGAFKWETSFNFALNKNEVTKLAEGQQLIDNNGSRSMNVVQVGQPLGAFLGYEFAGVDRENGDALFFVNETNEAGSIINPDATTNNVSEANFIILGQSIPDKLIGFTNDFSYRGLSLNVFFQGSFGNKIANAAGGFMSCGACWFDNQTRDQLDAWTPDNRDTDIPEARFYWENGTNGRSSRYLSDGNFVRLKTATLAYELPSSLTSKAGLSRLRVYVTGQNLLTFTNYEGWDPELASDSYSDGAAINTNIYSSVDFYTAPQARTIIVGVNVGL